MKKLLTLCTIFLISVSCTNTEMNEEIEEYDYDTDVERATATVMSLGNNEVAGTVTFEEADEEGVDVVGTFTGLTEGRHGVHIHQYGDCSAEDGSSAGGHFSPRDNDHGSPTQDNRHMGDMGNLAANEDGLATIEYTDMTISLDEILGRGVIVHAGEDDFTSQPSGAAGSRIACGVIGIAR